MVLESPDIRLLRDASNRIAAEMEALRNRLSGLESAHQLIVAEIERADEHGERAPRGNVKSALLDLLQEAGVSGLNAATAVVMARRRRIELDRNTVSSLLSRFKRDGVVDHDGFRYRLKEYALASRQLEAACS